MDWPELLYELSSWARKGSKASRRRLVSRARSLVEHARAHGARHPSQLSRAIVYGWIEQANRLERYYTARRLWITLGRGELPKPACLADQGEGEPAKPGEGRSPSPGGSTSRAARRAARTGGAQPPAK